MPWRLVGKWIKFICNLSSLIVCVSFAGMVVQDFVGLTSGWYWYVVAAVAVVASVLWGVGQWKYWKIPSGRPAVLESLRPWRVCYLSCTVMFEVAAVLMVLFYVGWCGIPFAGESEVVPASGWGVDLSTLVPPEAREFRYKGRTGLGWYTDWRCRVGEADFLAFAARKKWKLEEADRDAAYTPSFEYEAGSDSFWFCRMDTAHGGGILIVYDRSCNLMYGSEYSH